MGKYSYETTCRTILFLLLCWIVRLQIKNVNSFQSLWFFRIGISFANVYVSFLHWRISASLRSLQPQAWHD